MTRIYIYIYEHITTAVMSLEFMTLHKYVCAVGLICRSGLAVSVPVALNVN